MTSAQQRQRDLERLQHLLEVYGGDRDRWPLHERRAVAELLARDSEAQKLVKEALVLDELIESAHLTPERNQEKAEDLAKLGDRIMAAALAERRQARSADALKPAAVHAIRHRARPARLWPAASLLAACLVLGIMVGRSGVMLDQNTVLADASGAEDVFSGAISGFIADESIFFAEEDTL